MDPGSRWEGPGSQSWRTISKRTAPSSFLKPCVRISTVKPRSGLKPSFDCLCDEQNVCRLVTRRHPLVFEHRWGADARPHMGVRFLFQHLSPGRRTFLASGRRTARCLHKVHIHLLCIYRIVVARIEGQCALAEVCCSADDM